MIKKSIIALFLTTFFNFSEIPQSVAKTHDVTKASDQQNQQSTAAMRIMHIDLDYVFDTDKSQQTKNINTLIQRIQVIKPNTVFLQAFADPDANGSAKQVYFHNDFLPSRGNLFQEVNQAIKTNTSVQKVYAWLPLLAWEIDQSYHLTYVKHRHVQGHENTEGYIRLSPFDAKNIKMIQNIFLQFIQNNQVDGILFHDDITLSDFEDASVLALQQYQKWGFSENVFKHNTHPLQIKLAQHKTAHLDSIAFNLEKKLKQQQPQLKFARNMYANVVLDPKSEIWFAQSMPSTYQHYDFNAIMAMPYMEKAADHQKFYLDLIEQSKKFDPDLKRTIFELQTVNWETQEKISDQELKETIHFLKIHGVQHIGYYPDDFIQNHPNAKMMQENFNP